MQTREPSSLDPNPIGEVLQKGTTLQSLCKKTQLIQTANAILTQVLPQSLHSHCYIANVEEELITIYANHGTWATHLRYQQEILLQAFRQNLQFIHIKYVKIRLHLPELNPPKPYRPLHMSRQISSIIQDAAKHIKQSQLKEALLRLAKNGEKSN